MVKKSVEKIEKIVIVIDRSKWRTGGNYDEVNDTKNLTGRGHTELCNTQGYYCCLGFIGKKFRKNKPMVGCMEPDDCEFDIPELIVYDNSDFYGKSRKNSDLTKNAIEINDDCTTTVKQKETKLKTLFKNSCYKLEFVGEPTYMKKKVETK